MLKKLRLMFLVAVLGLAWAVAAPVGAQSLSEVGPPIAPHGYPAYFGDSNGLNLELCLPDPAGYSTRPDLCVFDPLDVENPLIVAGESFWWLANASVPMPGGGEALLTLAVEATFGGDHNPINGNQITFARTRIRIDTPVAGTYVVTHPYGEITFEDVAADDRGINYTSDIGSTNFRDVAGAYAGTLDGGIGPFLTWPGYADNPALQVRDPETDEVLEQYIGDPNVPSLLTDGTDRPIVFRIEGPEFNGQPIVVETNQFLLMGKVLSIPLDQLDPLAEELVHEFPPVPDPNLFAVGPVNRAVPFNATSVADPFLHPEGLITGVEHAYPKGLPLWYQEDDGIPEGGLQLTLCPPFDPMCIGDPIDTSDPTQVEFGTGGEQFWFLAVAEERVGDLRYLLTLAVEATFGGDHEIVDGNQIAFGRERIRIDTDVAGTYRVTHPYGQRIFENVGVDSRAINFTSDIGIADPADPDGAFVGTLYSDIGPTFLTWPEFDPTLQNPPAALVKTIQVPDPDNLEQTVARDVHYIGDPAELSPVVGGTFVVPGSTEPVDYFLVERLISGTPENGTWQEVIKTSDFSVMGKIYHPETFAAYNLVAEVGAPVAQSFPVTLDLNEASAAVITVINQDSNVEGESTINIVSPPLEGIAVSDNNAGTITYTPSADFALVGGVDQFNYSITADNGTSNIASVTVTVIPVTPQEVVTINKARLSLNKLRWDISGGSNMPGTTLTVYPGVQASGEAIGTVVVANNGKWRLRATTTNNANVTSISIGSSTGEEFNNLPLDVR
ncbi:hypothetical protein SAMN05660860_01276 [Geoalkalibacter ferrihydriticus]|uniref:Uncharacterized protein n=2 Tax=Geoalkalibacter ferrihydriticus TaxID=392333 RepID=A0A0C2DWF6_9BACT|nr:cadherin-like domain-containing protein [Geoalkalibacter ferrihydriticus]KIH77779.1 hypothetical protein GFER_03795 [Geoalkalibacter ferrihydriticus DSM 17813]SDL78576.1 hypothetical protein SAMN05660860_01276 [Geoalkalibacter ferrihydriticus]